MTKYPWGILDTRTGKVAWFRTQKERNKELKQLRGNPDGQNYRTVYN
jgi:hypothetical protein